MTGAISKADQVTILWQDGLTQRLHGVQSFGFIVRRFFTTGESTWYLGSMRLLHLADLHIGIENYGRVDPATGLHSRLRDYLGRLDEAIDIGLDAGVDAVLIAGDVYKNRTPNPTQQREFARRIHRLRALGLPVLILTGNHDVSPAAGRAHAVEIFDTLAVDGVTIADRPRIHTLHTRSGPLQVIALPWVRATRC
jgi:DNA repair exonuclease